MCSFTFYPRIIRTMKLKGFPPIPSFLDTPKPWDYTVLLKRNVLSFFYLFEVWFNSNKFSNKGLKLHTTGHSYKSIIHKKIRDFLLFKIRHFSRTLILVLQYLKQNFDVYKIIYLLCNFLLVKNYGNSQHYHFFCMSNIVSVSSNTLTIPRQLLIVLLV